jgi:hypothetical protein
MDYTSDHDGKSKTASAVDQKNYPEQHEVENQGWETGALPTHEQIKQRAHEIWMERGRPEGTAEEDWRQAEEELRAGIQSRHVIESTKDRGGSVQP